MGPARYDLSGRRAAGGVYFPFKSDAAAIKNNERQHRTAGVIAKTLHVYMHQDIIQSFFDWSGKFVSNLRHIQVTE